MSLIWPRPIMSDSAGIRTELRVPGAAAQTRTVSGGHFLPRKRQLLRNLKHIGQTLLKLSFLSSSLHAQPGSSVYPRRQPQPDRSDRAPTLPSCGAERDHAVMTSLVTELACQAAASCRLRPASRKSASDSRLGAGGVDGSGGDPRLIENQKLIPRVLADRHLAPAVWRRWSRPAFGRIADEIRSL
jgi:hypothetical protein